MSILIEGHVSSLAIGVSNCARRCFQHRMATNIILTRQSTQRRRRSAENKTAARGRLMLPDSPRPSTVTTGVSDVGRRRGRGRTGGRSG